MKSEFLALNRFRYGMDKEDARKQTLAQLHERRKQVVRLHKQGMGTLTR